VALRLLLKVGEERCSRALDPCLEEAETSMVPESETGKNVGKAFRALRNFRENEVQLVLSFISPSRRANPETIANL